MLENLSEIILSSLKKNSIKKWALKMSKSWVKKEKKDAITKHCIICKKLISILNFDHFLKILKIDFEWGQYLIDKVNLFLSGLFMYCSYFNFWVALWNHQKLS